MLPGYRQLSSYVGGWPSRAQFYRWLSGSMIGLPYADHCRILETMFPNWTAKQLFEESNGNLESCQAKDPAVTTPAAREWTTPEESLLAEIPHTLSAHTLNGLWVTCYQFRSGQRTGKALEFHADLAHLTPESDRRVRIKNHPPEPRTNGQPLPFRNDVEAEVVNRHLIGHWKNTSDTRYFGSIHLAILPGETVIEGYYTGLDSDIEVSTQRWTWVRIDPASLVGVNLSGLVLREPDAIHELIGEYSQYACPLMLAAVTEEVG